MCASFSDDNLVDSVGGSTFEEVQAIVESEFDVKESFVDHDVPTFHVKYREDSKEAFLKLIKRLEPLELIPILRQKEEKVLIQVLPKPPIKPSQNTMNIALFFATLGTVFVSGYYQSADILGALLFTGAIMAILGSHEMGHKLLADKHKVEATYPYFIPGLPPIGTFGAVIRQKALPPNKDALFDIGFTGPITGFIMSILMMIIGMQLPVQVVQDPTVVGTPLEELYPLMYRFIIWMFPPSAPEGATVILHPVVFAGYVGMIVTMLNLVPSGMFDGGHVARSVMGDRAHKIVSYAGVALLAITGWWPMAILAFFFSSAKHPGPLDDVSKLTASRKVGAIILVVIFILSIVPIGLSF